MTREEGRERRAGRVRWGRAAPTSPNCRDIPGGAPTSVGTKVPRAVTAASLEPPAARP